MPLICHSVEMEAGLYSCTTGRQTDDGVVVYC